MGSENKKTLILIDGHALAFREYFALERTNMQTSDNQPTWAVYGFFKQVFDLLKGKKIKPDAIAVAFDVSHHTFRTEEYVEYKANREVMPTSLQSQMSLIYEGLDAFNIPIYKKEGFEADDVIGTITKKAKELGHRTYILTGDQDSFQLIDREECTKVLLPTPKGLKEYGYPEVYDKFGVYPHQIADYKGLCGDTSDNIPGIRGIGPKTAVKLLGRYGDVETVLAECENITEKGVREKVCAGKDIAKLSKHLATIVRNVDIDFDFESTKVEPPNVQAVTEFLQRLQFHSFIRNSAEILKLFGAKDAKVEDNSPVVTQISSSNAPVQLGFFANAVEKAINQNSAECEKFAVSNKADLEKLVQDLNSQNFVAIQLDADVQNAVSAQLNGIAVAFENNNKVKSYYVNIDSLTDRDIICAFKPVLESEKIKKSLFDSKKIRNVLRANGVYLRGVDFDAMLASYIKDPARKHELSYQSLENLNHVAMSLDNPTVSDECFRYYSETAFLILELTKFWKKDLTEDEMKLLKEAEIPLSEVLADMEYVGVSVDENYLKDLSQYFTENLLELEKRVYEIAGCEFNINSPKKVGEILYDKLDLCPKKKSAKAKKSTAADILDELAEENEIVRLILKYRGFAKLRSTYTEALLKLVNPIDSRIHTSYNQVTTVTGRLSSSNPNLQNIPIRTEEGNKIRKAFVPKDREKYELLSADYSQIELRLLAHVSGDKHLIEAFNSGEDIHALTASKVYDVSLEDVTKDMRRKAKAVNFGIVYGQSKYGLAKSLGITNSEAQEFIDKYFATYPKVMGYMQGEVDFANKNGYVETIFGRKRYLKTELDSSNFRIREFAQRAAINQPLQGTAADLMKFVMVDLYKKLKEKGLKSKIIMQVHDELVLEVEKSELDVVKSLVKEAMEHGQPFAVPLLVDISVGENWQE